MHASVRTASELHRFIRCVRYLFIVGGVLLSFWLCWQLERMSRCHGAKASSDSGQCRGRPIVRSEDVQPEVPSRCTTTVCFRSSAPARGAARPTHHPIRTGAELRPENPGPGGGRLIMNSALRVAT
eukprot:767609-Hanusia_phi.AAC.1